MLNSYNEEPRNSNYVSNAPNRASRRSADYRNMASKKINAKLSEELNRLLLTAPIEERENYQDQFEDFKKIVEKLILEQNILWQKIGPVLPDDVYSYESLGEPEIIGLQNYLKKLVVVRMYEDSAASNTFEGPRYLLAVHSGLSFLDIWVLHLEFINKTYDTDIPLVLMLSYHTKECIESMLMKFKGRRVKIYTLEQYKYPKLYKETFVPAETDLTDPNADAWYAAGQADFYRAFSKSNLLLNFINEGREICFLANGDNLGATIDFKILHSMVCPLNVVPARPRFDFMMELSEKTKADKASDTLIQYDGMYRLLHECQIAENHKDDFRNPNKFRLFNTNNLWIRLKTIHALNQRGGVRMDINCKYTTFSDGKEVMQFERAIASGIKSFRGICCLIVPRSRFRPVKTASDLLLIKSNLYNIRNGTIILNPKRTLSTLPTVKLDEKFFRFNEDCFSRFMTIPDMLDLEELIVFGDVRFRRDVVLKGRVFIEAEKDESMDIPDGSVLENKAIFGSLKIYDY